MSFLRGHGRVRHGLGPYPRLWTTSERERQRREHLDNEANQEIMNFNEHGENYQFYLHKGADQKVFEKLWSQLLTSDRARDLGLFDAGYFRENALKRSEDYREYYFGNAQEFDPLPNEETPIDEESVPEAKEDPEEALFKRLADDLGVEYFVDTLNITKGKIRPVVQTFYEEQAFADYHKLTRKTLHRKTKDLKKWILQNTKYNEHAQVKNMNVPEEKVEQPAFEQEVIPVSDDEKELPPIPTTTVLSEDLPVQSDLYFDKIAEGKERLKKSNEISMTRSHNNYRKFIRQHQGNAKIYEALLDGDYEIEPAYRALMLQTDAPKILRLISPTYLKHMISIAIDRGGESATSLSANETEGSFNGRSSDSEQTESDEERPRGNIEHYKDFHYQRADNDMNEKELRSREVLKDLMNALEKTKHFPKPKATKATEEIMNPIDPISDKVYASSFVHERPEETVLDIDNDIIAHTLITDSLQAHVFPQLLVLEQMDDEGRREMIRNIRPSLTKALTLLSESELDTVVKNALDSHDTYGLFNRDLNNILRFKNEKEAHDELSDIVHNGDAAVNFLLRTGKSIHEINDDMVAAVQFAAANMNRYMDTDLFKEYKHMKAKEDYVPLKEPAPPTKKKAVKWTNPKTGEEVKTYGQTHRKSKRTNPIYDQDPISVQMDIVANHDGYLRGAPKEVWPTRQMLEHVGIGIRPQRYGGVNASKEIMEKYWTTLEVEQTKQKRREKTAKTRENKKKRGA